MNFVNPLDKLPPIRQDYANHVIYGFLLCLVVALVAHAADLPLDQAWSYGYFVTSVVALAKKIVDYFYEHESAQTCFLKVAATVAIPMAVVILRSEGLV